MNILGIVWFLFMALFTIFAMKKLRWAVLILPAFFPLYLIKFSAFGVPFNLIELMVYVIAVIAFVNLFIRKLYGSCLSAYKLRFLNFLIVAGFLIFGTLLGSYISYLYGDLSLSLGILKGWVLMPILYAAVLVFRAYDNRDRLLMLRAYMVSSVFLSIWALYQVWSGNFITIDGRASGPFESANYLALYIAPLVFALIARAWQALRDRRFFKEFFRVYLVEIVVFFVVGFALLFSMSYGGILGVFGSLILFALYEILFSSHRKIYGRLWKRLMIPAIVLALGALVVLSQIQTTKFVDFLAFNRQSSSSVRLQVWGVASHYISENPVIGVGPGRFEKLYENNAAAILGVQPYEPTMLHPHNLFLATYLNSGVAGILAFTWLFIGMFLAFKHGIFTKNDKDFIIIFIGMFGVIFLHGFVDQPFWKNDLALIWWMTVVPVLIAGFPVIDGKIERGEGVGKQIGYPTINIVMPKEKGLEGVYVCGVYIEGKKYFGAGYVGEKKGLADGKFICEVYLFGKCGDVYGCRAEVTLLKKIRDVQKLDNLKELKEQIAKDELFSKKYLKFAKYAKFST